MDSIDKDSDSGLCAGAGGEPYSIKESKEEEEEEDSESKSLLESTRAVNGGGIARTKRQRSSKRRVQWNDRNGNKLVEILEYQPSDSSDSEDESSSGDWTWMCAIAGCIHICCSWGGPKV